MRLAPAALFSLLLLTACGTKHSKTPAYPDDPPPEKSPAQGQVALPSAEPNNPLASVAPTKDGWYDAKPLLVSLRPAYRQNLAQLAGLSKLEELPLYDLAINLDPEAGSFELDETVYFTNRERQPLKEIVFRIWGNVSGKDPQGNPRAPHISLSKSACQDHPCEIRQESPSVLSVRLDSPLGPGQRMRVSFGLQGLLEKIDSKRTGMLSQSLEGMMSLGSKEGSGDYGLLAVGDGIASLANAYAVLGRYQNGKWDKTDGNGIGDIGSDDLSNVRATLDVPAVTNVAAVGTVAGEGLRPAQKGQRPQRRMFIAAAMVRDFVVLAGAFDTQSRTLPGGITVHSHFLPADRAAGEKVLAIASSALSRFENRFGPYPYQELDTAQAALIGGAGGVEFSGLLTVASMFYHPDKDNPLANVLGGAQLPGMPDISQLSGNMLEFVTAHEVAHQWWHVLIGSDSRQHPFVDESLTQYATLIYLEDAYGADKARRDGDTNVKMNYQMMRMMGQSDAPVNRPVDSFQSSMAYAGLVYGKGPYFYQEARKALGDEAFFAALRAYADKYRFRTAPRTGPLELLIQGPKAKQVQALAQRWLEETHGDQDLGKGSMQGLGSLLGGGGGGQGTDTQALIEQAMKVLGPMLENERKGKDAKPGKGQDKADPSGQEIDQMLQNFGGLLDN